MGLRDPLQRVWPLGFLGETSFRSHFQFTEQGKGPGALLLGAQRRCGSLGPVSEAPSQPRPAGAPGVRPGPAPPGIQCEGASHAPGPLSRWLAPFPQPLQVALGSTGALFSAKAPPGPSELLLSPEPPSLRAPGRLLRGREGLAVLSFCSGPSLGPALTGFQVRGLPELVLLLGIWPLPLLLPLLLRALPCPSALQMLPGAGDRGAAGRPTGSHTPTMPTWAVPRVPLPMGLLWAPPEGPG